MERAEHVRRGSDDPASIIEEIFFTPKDFEEGVLYDFRLGRTVSV
jgi:hypothetical protein